MDKTYLLTLFRLRITIGQKEKGYFKGIGPPGRFTRL